MIDPEFASALVAHGFVLPDDQAERIEAYVRSVWKWNEQINMTRHTTWDLFVGRDLRDCLQLAPLIGAGETVLDLGSGAGVPGVPLAIMRPDVKVSLAESVGKRAKILDEMAADLDLPVAVYAARGEELLEDFRFSTITCRAVGSLYKLCQWLEPHWPSVGRLLAIKGPKWIEERAEARHRGAMNELQIRVATSYPLGDGDSEGVILQVWPKGRDLPGQSS
jgi:16S rRNA (guanine527-N7)-methyltransferase